MNDDSTHYTHGKVNSPLRSKTNATGLVALAIGLASSFGLIPEEAKEPVNEIALIAFGTLVPIFRTWFTVK